jgi:hypothetical protein
MQESENKNNLSKIGIYDLLRIKNPRRFHIEAVKKNISQSIDLLKIASKDLQSTPYKIFAYANEMVAKELDNKVRNTIWQLVAILESTDEFLSMRQSHKDRALYDADKIVEKLNSDECII